MSKYIALSLASLFLIAASSSGDQYSDIQHLLVGSSCLLELDDGYAPLFLEFLSIDERDGTFRMFLELGPAGQSAVQVNGRFTFVPGWSIPGTIWHMDEYYRMEFQRPIYVFFAYGPVMLAYTAKLNLLPDVPWLQGTGFYRFANYASSRTGFHAERVCIPS